MGDDSVCEDPADARAGDLVGAVATTSEMAWWVEKASTLWPQGCTPLGSSARTWAWSNGYGYRTVEEASVTPSEAAR